MELSATKLKGILLDFIPPGFIKRSSILKGFMPCLPLVVLRAKSRPTVALASREMLGPAGLQMGLRQKSGRTQR
jgi:hypothetical protein